MATVLSKRKTKVSKVPTMLTISGVPATLFFIIMLFLWSSSTTYISDNDRAEVPNDLKNDSNKLSKALIDNLATFLERKVGNDKVEVMSDIKGDSEEVSNTSCENPTTSLERSVRNDKVEVTSDLKEVSSVVNDRIEKIKTTNKIVEEQLLVHRSWITKRNQNQSQYDGRGIYVYDLPMKFNKDLVTQCHEMVQRVDMCKYFTNNGMGEPIPNTVFSRLKMECKGNNNSRTQRKLGSRWFVTHQYSLELIFHSRVLNHPCRVNEQNNAKLFYVPYYGGLDIMRWHFKNVSNEVKDSLGFELLNWLQMQKSWGKNLGKDHVFVLRKITWEFRRYNHTNWGSRFLQVDEMQNPIKLMIERHPWEMNDVGIPHPTHFHPHSDKDVHAWQSEIISSKRRSLISFAGAARPLAKYNIRSILIHQCTSATIEQCKFFYCKLDICDEPHSLIGLFTESEFCLQAPGDSATRKSVFDALTSGCIPVIFDPFTAYYQYPWHLPPDHTKYSVFIDQEDVKDMKVNVVEILMKVTLKKRDDMRRYIVYELMPKLVYGDQKAKFDSFQDAFSITINNLIERVKTVNLD